MGQACASCGTDEVVIRIQTIMGPVTQEIWLCRVCADRHGIDDKEPAIEPRVADLLTGLLRPRPPKRRKKTGGEAAKGNDGSPRKGEISRGSDLQSRPGVRKESSFPGDDVPENGRECPSCGLTLAQLKKNGRVGCVHCYTVFRPIIETVMKEQSFVARHIGRLPERYARFRYIFIEREGLKRNLRAAIDREEYEEAGRIHGKIRRSDIREGLIDDSE